MNKNNEHLIPEIIKNLCESFDKTWISKQEKVINYQRLETTKNYIQEILFKKSEFK